MAQEPSASLLSTLNQLYARVTRRLWRGRAQSYHEGIEQDLDTDINPLLDARLDKMKPVSTGNSQQRPQVEVTPVTASDDTPVESRPAASTQEISFVAGDVLEGLTMHFKEGNGPSQLDREAGGKLKQSTWDHIHSALRLMRQGDAENARLHSKIANNAMKEAGHYLPADEYRAFVSEVTDYLQQHPA